jgi:hypothetical protein
MKIAVFWVVAPCSLVEVYQRSRGPCCLHHQRDDRPDDGGSKDLWNVGKLLPDYMVLQPRRQQSSFLNLLVKESTISDPSNLKGVKYCLFHAVVSFY